MRKLFILLVAAVGMAATASAQKIDNTSYEGYLYSEGAPKEGIELGMKYKELKNIYNPKMYTPAHTDRYNPSLAGLTSFIFPGVGQMSCGETGRGWKILGSYLGCQIIGAALMLTSESQEMINGKSSDGLYLVGSAFSVCGFALNIWSIVDAVKVAKVRNMYDQDLKKIYHKVDIALQPSVSYINTGSKVTPTAGMTLAINF